MVKEKYQFEIWRPVFGYEGWYEVSNFGRVRSLCRIVKHPKKGYRMVYGRILKQIECKGYLHVHLSKNGEAKVLKVHRLVAIAFLPNPHNYPEINHKWDKTENKVFFNADGTINYEKTTIEWCDRKYNCNYGQHNEKLSKANLNHHKKSKPILCIELNITYPSIGEASRQTKINRGNLSVCVKRQRNTAGGYHWKYVNEKEVI